MEVIIAGSRVIRDMALLERAIMRAGFTITTVVSGTAQGADRLGEQWASKHGIPVKQFPAQWRKHGHSAGYKRNETMADNADALIALWDGKSRGTKHMIDIARRKGLPVYVLVND